MARVYKAIYCEEGFEDKIDAALAKLINSRLGQESELDMEIDWDEADDDDDDDEGEGD